MCWDTFFLSITFHFLREASEYEEKKCASRATAFSDVVHKNSFILKYDCD